MKIGIDARFVGPSGTGLGKYTEKLIENLKKIDSKNQYFIFLRKENWDYLKLGKNFKKILADVPWYSLIEQVTLPKIFRSQNLDLLHVPHFNVPIFYNPPGFGLLGLHERSEFKGEFIVTIHDLIHHQFAETSTTARNLLIFKAKRLAYRQVIAHAIKKSAKIIVPSKNIKEEVISTFRIDPSKVVVTYEAAEEEYFQKSNVPPEARLAKSGKSQRSNVLEKFSIRKPFLIYVGNAYPHKNLEKLLEAFKILTMNYELKTRNLKLILVCSRDVFWQRLAKQMHDQKLNDSVLMTGYIPARELSVLFRQAKAYVFPSLSEGFGIPGLNAMAAGLPVVCSNIPTLKEVYGDAAMYFNPHSPKDIAAKIQEVITDQQLRSDLIENGREQVQKYSWLKMARQTLRVYESVFV